MLNVIDFRSTSFILYETIPKTFFKGMGGCIIHNFCMAFPVGGSILDEDPTVGRYEKAFNHMARIFLGVRSC